MFRQRASVVETYHVDCNKTPKQTQDHKRKDILISTNGLPQPFSWSHRIDFIRKLFHLMYGQPHRVEITEIDVNPEVSPS
jgi:hypothetical protein